MSGLEGKIMQYEKERKRQGVEMVVFASDIHLPFEDKQSIDALTRFVKLYRPEILILGGDIMDMYGVSRFDKNPLRANRLQEELDETRKFLERIRNATPRSRIIYLEGNHEDRLRKWLWKNPDLHGLRILSVQKLLELESLNIEWRKDFVKDKYLFTHGEFANKYHSNKHLERNGVSGMSGHVHNPQRTVRTSRGYTVDWTGVGHLCDTAKVEYDSNPNWEHGFGVVCFHEGNHYAENIPIKKGKIVYGGRAI